MIKTKKNYENFYKQNLMFANKKNLFSDRWRWLCRKRRNKIFLDKKVNVTCLDNLTYGQKFNLKHKLLNFLNLNITRKNDIKKINKYFDTVIILAGLVGDPITKKYKSLSTKINEIAIINLINYFNEKRRCKKLFFVSTCSNYGLVKKI